MKNKKYTSIVVRDVNTSPPESGRTNRQEDQ